MESKRTLNRSSHPELFLRKGVLKICTKFTGEHPCRSAISIKLLWNFIEITLRHACSPANWCIFSEHFFLRTTLDSCFWLKDLCEKATSIYRCGHNLSLVVVSARKVLVVHNWHSQGSFTSICKDLFLQFQWL